MTFKWIFGSDIAAVDPIVAAQNWTELPPDSVIFTAEDEGGIGGFIVLRRHPHPEPLWVREDLRGTDLALQLSIGMFKFLKDTNISGALVIADNPHAEEICKLLKLKKIESPVYMVV